jgi:hypothetical protein
MKTKHLQDASKLCIADLHLHTNLSRCASSDTTISSYLQVCAREGINEYDLWHFARR